MFDHTEERGEPDTEDRAGTIGTTTRRRLLRGGAASAGAVVFGLGATGAVGADQPEVPGQAGAPGKGGEAVVPSEDFEEEQFHILERPDPTESVIFECNEGTDRPILLVGWHFRYQSEETGTRTLYTRDNNVETGEDVVYNWSGNGAKRCSPATDPREFIQTPYRGRNVA